MDLIFAPVVILGTNMVAGVLLAVLRDAAGSLFRGETQLVLQKLIADPNPQAAETSHVEISGRKAGLIGYLLTLLDLSPTIRLTGNQDEIRKSSTSLHGHSVEIVPVSHNISVSAESRRSLIWLVAALAALIVGVPLGLTMGEGFLEKIVNAVAWLAAAIAYLGVFYLSHTFQVYVTGTARIGVSFKPSIIEGRMIRFEEVLSATEVLALQILNSRAAAQTGPPMATMPAPPDYGALEPKPAYSENGSGDDEETLHQPIGPPPQKPPERENTGTVEYGDDLAPGAVSPSDWDGSPEPGTSDSIQFRRSIARSEQGMFVGTVPMTESEEAADEALDSADTDDNGGTYRGTVSWEEHADKTQDEVRAEAELAELKRSRPRRGEARLRLKELMRRYPQTEAAKKAQRMLERLDAIQ